MTRVAADEPTTTIAPGATVTAVVNTVGDVDLFNIQLVAGQTYSFSLAGSGSTPLIDPILTLTRNGVEVASDDDGGNGTDSLLTFTPTQTGTYQVRAAAYPDSGLTGEYTLAVRQMGEDSVSPAYEDATPIAADATAYGFIESNFDTDMYTVTLVEGMYYTFELAGGTDYNTPDGDLLPPGELNTLIQVHDFTGYVIAQNTDLSLEDMNSSVSFVAPRSGTYYVGVHAAYGQVGGYTLEITSIDLSTADPLHTIDWGTQLASTEVLVYFAPAGETFDDVTSLGWTDYEIAQALAALDTYAVVSNLNFTRTSSPTGATFWLVTTESDEFLGYFNPPGTENAGVGVFARNGAGWSAEGGLEPGGSAFTTLIHEFGHGLGLAHPHDNGGTSTVMPGVTAAFDNYGAFDLNQGVYTTMSYNDGWQEHPSWTYGSLTFGNQATPGPLDVAVIQASYGASINNAGDTVYTLPRVNDGGWNVIWDTGGNDTIVHSGPVSALINLTSATLDYSTTGGGVPSFVGGIFGGFTIAAGVVIENATGGAGVDMLVGNAADNILSGGGQQDTLFGGAGADTFRGTTEELSSDRITDFTAGDRIIITDATLASFAFSYSTSNSILTFSGGYLWLTNRNRRRSRGFGRHRWRRAGDAERRPADD